MTKDRDRGLLAGVAVGDVLLAEGGGGRGRDLDGAPLVAAVAASGAGVRDRDLFQGRAPGWPDRAGVFSLTVKT